MGTALRILMVDRETGLSLVVGGILRLSDGQWWNGTAWGPPPSLAAGPPTATVAPLAPLAPAGFLAGEYWASYPTDTTGFGPVTGTVVAYIWNHGSGKFEGRAFGRLIAGDDAPLLPVATAPIAAAFPTKGTFTLSV